MNSSTQAVKLKYADVLARLAKLQPENWPEALGNMDHDDVAWHDRHPINSHQGGASVLANFWRREGDLQRENWVFIDQLDLLVKMDCDMMGMLQ